MYSVVMNLGVGGGCRGWNLDDCGDGDGGAIVLFWPDSEEWRSVDLTLAD